MYRAREAKTRNVAQEGVVTGVDIAKEGIFKIADVCEGTRGGTETYRIVQSKLGDGLEGRGTVRMGTID